MPVWNVEDYIYPCIESIVNQEIRTPYVIICVDDCSTDSTYNVLGQIADQYSCVRIFQNNTNMGVSYTRNFALSLAVYDYIWFIDPDDMVVNGAVSWMLELAQENSADVILGNYKRIPDNFCSMEKFQILPELQYTNQLSCVLPKDDLGIAMCAVWAGVFRREFLVNNHLEFRIGMIAQEDTLFYYEADQVFPRVTKTDSVCYLYRMRKSSVMHSKSAERSVAYYNSMKIMMQVYMSYWKNGKCRDEAELKRKIHHMKENLALCLAMCIDENMVRHELRVLREKGYYPYQLRKEIFKSQKNIRGIMTFLLPFSICFWVEHMMYKVFISRKMRNSDSVL